MIRGVLYRKSINDCMNRNQLVLPYCFMEHALSGLQTDMVPASKGCALSPLQILLAKNDDRH